MTWWEHRTRTDKVVLVAAIVAVIVLGVYFLVDYNSPSSRYERCVKEAEDIALQQNVPVTLVLMSSDHGCGNPPS
jgi:flagellar biosynthesis/type III secretory pathway M-ring protein FliF/YscJ